MTARRGLEKGAALGVYAVKSEVLNAHSQDRCKPDYVYTGVRTLLNTAFTFPVIGTPALVTVGI